MEHLNISEFDSKKHYALHELIPFKVNKGVPFHERFNEIKTNSRIICLKLLME